MGWVFSYIYRTEIPVLDMKKNFRNLKRKKNHVHENSNIRILGFVFHMLSL